MWDGLWMVLSLGGIMALASFLAGSLPLFLSLSARQIRTLSTIGTGLLVGTALIVIIPEGIETLYAANGMSSSHAHGAASMVKTAVSGSNGEEKGAMAALAHHGVGPQQQSNEEAGRAEELAHLNGRAVVNWLLRRAVAKAGGTHEHEESSSHAWIGVALILGFMLMYLIDALQSSTASTRGSHIPLAQMDNEDEEAPQSHPVLDSPAPSSSKSTTIGLVIHSLADGIALGASSSSSSTQSTLGAIVFVAILIHKAPAAFGLTSVLLKQGLGKRAARGHLLVFSLAAPFGALMTWVLVNLLGGGRGSEGAETWWMGFVLVFSGGTFLYVAMHAMQETSHTSDLATNTKPRRDALLMVIGMLLPLLTQIGHAHVHGS